jgi:hypothetical protein
MKSYPKTASIKHTGRFTAVTVALGIPVSQTPLYYRGRPLADNQLAILHRGEDINLTTPHPCEPVICYDEMLGFVPYPITYALFAVGTKLSNPSFHNQCTMGERSQGVSLLFCGERAP